MPRPNPIRLAQLIDRPALTGDNRRKPGEELSDGRKKRRFTVLKFLDVLSLWPLWMALVGFVVAVYGGGKDNPERIRQGFAFTVPFQLCVLLVGVLLLVHSVTVLGVWCYRKYWY